MRTLFPTVWLLLACMVFGSSGSRADELKIDPGRSVITIRVDKSGLFSGFAHNHVVETRGLTGQVDTGPPAVRFQVDARSLKVLDPREKPNTRAEIQATMDGPKVLDVARFPDIRFESTSVTPAGDGRWKVAGNLTLHGQTRPVALTVTEGKDGDYRGGTILSQREFGIQPISLFGGTVKVRDALKVDFEVATVR